MVLLDMTVLSVAEPALASSLDTTMAGLQWATVGYTVAFAALLLSAGAAADRFGAERLFRAGIAVFTLASTAQRVRPGAVGPGPPARDLGGRRGGCACQPRWR